MNFMEIARARQSCRSYDEERAVEPEKIAAMTRLCLNHGVHILAPACGLGMKTPLANEQAMLSCLKEVYHG